MAEANTPLSVDEAANLLNPPIEAAPEVVAAPDEPEEILPTNEDEAEVEAQGEPDDAEAEAQPEIEVPDAPRWWDAEKKAVWATLTPEQRTAVADQEAKRELVVEKAKTEAKTERDQYAGVLNALSNAVPQWIDTFKSRWDGVNWADLARNYPAEQYNAWRAEFEADTQAINNAQAVQQLAQQQAEQSFYRERAERLPMVAPELADPAKGEKNLTDLSQYLVKEGFDVDTIRGASAEMMRTAWKAYKYDQLNPALTAKPRAAAPRPSVAPSSAPARTSQARSIEQLAARLAKTGDAEDAVRLLQARRGQK